MAKCLFRAASFDDANVAPRGVEPSLLQSGHSPSDERRLKRLNRFGHLTLGGLSRIVNMLPEVDSRSEILRKAGLHPRPGEVTTSETKADLAWIFMRLPTTSFLQRRFLPVWQF